MALKPLKEPNKFILIVGCLSLGVFLGFISTVIYPHRLIQYNLVPGFNLFGSPILSGLLMYWFGKYQTSKGKTISSLATFTGGALFAFGYFLFRFISIG